MLADAKDPWMKFYPQDWSGDEKLSMCSLAARGLFASCLHLMHTAVPYGHLLIHGQRPSYDDIAKFVRCKPREAKWGIEELIKNEALSLTSLNVVYSRRMVRDGARRKRSQDNGAKSPGNPKLTPDSGVTQISTSGVSKNEKSGITPIASSLSLEEFTDPIEEAKAIAACQVFSERYPEIFARVRKAHYPGTAYGNRDYPNFMRLVRAWPVPRLEQMLEVFLLMNARDSNNIPGTPGQFLNMAPECDRRLRENGL